MCIPKSFPEILPLMTLFYKHAVLSTTNGLTRLAHTPHGRRSQPRLPTISNIASFVDAQLLQPLDALLRKCNRNQRQRLASRDPGNDGGAGKITHLLGYTNVYLCVSPSIIIISNSFAKILSTLANHLAALSTP